MNKSQQQSTVSVVSGSEFAERVQQFAGVLSPADVAVLPVQGMKLSAKIALAKASRQLGGLNSTEGSMTLENKRRSFK